MQSVFTRLSYPSGLIDSTINKFIRDSTLDASPKSSTDDIVLRFSIPFKDQTSADAVTKQLRDLISKIGINLQPVFTSRTLEEDLKYKETKPSIVNQHCVMYLFKCDLCDADYVGCTTRHLHQRIADHFKWRIPMGTLICSTRVNLKS